MSESVKLAISTLPHHEGLDLPAYQTGGASGLDLTAACQEDVTIEPGKRALIPTGISIAVPQGYEAQIRPRSGLALKNGITLPIPQAPSTAITEAKSR